MRKRIVASLAMTVAAAGVALGAPAAQAVGVPAQAAGAPGYVLYKTLPPDGCQSLGYYGEYTTHQWQSYYCEILQPAGASTGGSANLWVHY